MDLRPISLARPKWATQRGAVDEDLALIAQYRCRPDYLQHVAVRQRLLHFPWCNRLAIIQAHSSIFCLGWVGSDRVRSRKGPGGATPLSEDPIA